MFNLLKKYYWFPSSLLLIYVALLFKVLVFKDLPPLHLGHITLKFGGTQAGSGNLIPFKTILPYLLGEKGLLIGGLNIAGNIVLLIPVGFLLPFVFQKIKPFQVLFVNITFCLLIEIIQHHFKIGIFDIDDVILNATGVYVGFWIHSKKFFSQ